MVGTEVLVDFMAGHIGKDLEVDTDEDTEERSAMDTVTVTGNNEVIFCIL